jgi:hypothetical protein
LYFFLSTHTIVLDIFICHNHSIHHSMFIGQGLSLEARRAAKAERRAAINATAAASTVAAVVAERALSASPPLLLLALSPPAGILTPAAERTADLLGLSMGAAGLSTAAPSAAVATVTAAAPRVLAFGTSLAPPRRRTAQPKDQVLKKFPGEKGIMRPNMAPFLLVIFSLMDTVRPHVKVSH